MIVINIVFIAYCLYNLLNKGEGTEICKNSIIYIMER